MKLDELMNKVTEYGISVLPTKAKSVGAKMLIGGGTVVVAKKAREMIQSAGLVDGIGEVDMETLTEMARASFKAAGKVDVLGGALSFDAQDAEDLIAFVMR